MNIRRIGTDGKTSEMRRTGRRWRKSLAPSGEKDWFCKIGEDGLSSFASRITPGIFVGHRDPTGEVLCITKNGVVWGKIGRDRHWTILGMLRTGVACVAHRGKWWLLNCSWQKEVTAYKEGAGPPLPRIVVERAPEVDPRRFHVSSADIEAHGHIGIAWKSDKTTQQRMPRTNQNYHWEKLDGKARMNAYKNRFAKTERVKERERARVERGAGDVPIKHGNEEPMADRHAVDLARTKDNTTRT